jgi:hypothetical protein
MQEALGEEEPMEEESHTVLLEDMAI